MPVSYDATIAALAQETNTDEALVQCLYEEEFALLAAQSSVKSFIGVIAARRVRERLVGAREHERDRPIKADSARLSRAA
jgi:hypothetical protein